MSTTDRSRYRPGLAAAIAGALFMLFLIGAVVARFRPDGMARALFVTAAALGLVAVIALLAGKHRADATSVAEVLGLNAMFAVIFGASGWLFRSAARQPAHDPWRP